jgi:hypothetical protein
MRVIFLGFDGVLHPASAVSRFAPVAPLNRAVERAWLFRWAWILDELLDRHPNVGLVVHSNWRRLAPDEELQSFIGPLARRFAGSTPRVQRWESISSVVEQNRLRDFVILDAVPVAFPRGLHQLIACNPEAGLQDYSVRYQIKRWLDGKSALCDRDPARSK